MKISKWTIDVLKNFAVINDSIYISEVDYLKTISASGSIIAVYDLNIPFEKKFAIWNLSEFLSVISMFNLEETEFDFQDRFVKIQNGKNKVKYAYTEPQLIKGYNSLQKAEKYKIFDKFDGAFELSTSQIQSIRKMSNIMSLNTLKIQLSEESNLELIDQDYEDTNSNRFEIKLENTEGKSSISIDVENLEIISGDYIVKVLTNKMIKFINKNIPLFYFVTAKVS